jgi:ammonia channel protein AmtB
VAFGRELTFNVTAKGSTASPDRLWTFRYSLMWAVVPITILAVAVMNRRPYLLMIIWTFVVLAVCLAPIAVWQFDKTRSRKRERRALRSAEQHV